MKIPTNFKFTHPGEGIKTIHIANIQEDGTYLVEWQNHENTDAYGVHTAQEVEQGIVNGWEIFDASYADGELSQ